MGEILKYLEMAARGTPYIPSQTSGEIIKYVEMAAKGRPYIPCIKSKMEDSNGTRRTKNIRRNKK